MATFYNKATLSYGGNVLTSNTTEAELISGLILTKTAVTATYTAGGGVVYAVSLTNASASAYTGLTLVDDLGAYSLPEDGIAVPLTYVNGSIMYYLNGVLQPAPSVTAAGNLTVDGISVPPGGTALVIYEATANEFAPLAAGSTIRNTVTTDAGAGIGVLSASATVSVEEAPELTIAKAVCPAVINDNGELTYTIIVQNLGNVPIVATDGVIINDAFDPALSDITVTLNGVPLDETTGYTYNATTGEFATVDGVITVPAATYTQDPVSGTVTTTPGVTVLTVSGTV